MRITLTIIISLILAGCGGGKLDQTALSDQLAKKDPTGINWEPIQRDSIKNLITDHISFPGDDTLHYLPSDRELTLKFYFTGKMKTYMKHGKMIVKSLESSVFVKRIDNWSFKLRVNKPIDGWQIAMTYEYAFEKPYIFSYIHDSNIYKVEPNDTMQLFIRSEMTKPGNPWDYY